jgi:hypothetical protein
MNYSHYGITRQVRDLSKTVLENNFDLERGVKVIGSSD